MKPYKIKASVNDTFFSLSDARESFLTFFGSTTQETHAVASSSQK
jgi:hypothetical protein